jgi:phage terminase large subunit-like protein
VDAREQLARDLEELARRKRERRLADYTPYPKQIGFHAAGRQHRERLFMAGNQQGKTLAGGAEVAMHLTGHYPPWWKGRRFRTPIRAWASGVTGEATRDNVQRMLMGLPGEHGTGMIPKDAIHRTRQSRGMVDALDTIYVRHKSGGFSSLVFKSYERGREKWQGESLHLVWFDEEPPLEIYSEGLARITARKGLVFLTFTPLQGMSDVVTRYLMEPDNEDRHVTQMGIEEAEHIPAEERERIIDGYAPHEREARANGVPVLGSGKVFPIPEEEIAEEAPKLPHHWARICGLDFGWGHPTAAVWLAHDRDTDVIHVYDAYRKAEATPVVHAAAIRARGDWIPVAWPHDGLQHDKGSGVQLAEQYRNQGVAMLRERAQFADGSNGVEAGVQEMLDRMYTGRLKVAEHLGEWWEEFRMYHRKDGIIQKVRDDLMAATRYGVMMLRAATTEQSVRDWSRPIPYPDEHQRWIV